MPPTQYPLSGKAAPPPNSRDAFPSLQQGADPLGWTQGDPREPQGAQGYRRAPSAPLGGWAHGALWSYSEAIPSGKPFRMEGHYEITPLQGKWLKMHLDYFWVALGPKRCPHDTHYGGPGREIINKLPKLTICLSEWPWT